MKNIAEHGKFCRLCRKVILENAQREELETILRRVLREELKAVPSQPIPQQEEAIPKEMMGFLGSLLREE